MICVRLMQKTIVKTGLILCIIMSVFVDSGQAQSLKKARKLFQEEKYEQALIIFRDEQKTEQNPDYLLLRAICFYETKQIDHCLEDLKKLERFNTGNPENWKYAGLCLMKKGEYLEASRTLKKFISKVKPEHKDYASIILEIRRCGMALQRLRYVQSSFTENAGPIINSPGAEIRPVFSPNFQDRVYFSSSREGSTGGKRDSKGLLDETGGQYFLDMYYSDFSDGNWSTPTTFLPLLNSPKHDIVIDFNSDGNVMYYGVSADRQRFDYYSDTFSTTHHYDRQPLKIAFPLDGKKGDKDLFFYNDSLLLFASNHLPGYGGYDIFYCRKKDSVWTSPVNMGACINSSFDEVAPYFTKGGNTLYFASDRIDGFGGSDIFYVNFDHENHEWGKPQNVGLPVNSPWDENYFTLAPDGTNAIFTSNKPEGFGMDDLYIAYFKDQIIEQLLYAETPAFLSPASTKVTSDENESPAPRQKKEIRIRPLYYTSNADVLSNTNVPELVKLAETMLVYPDARLTIYSHSFQETARDMDLYLSMKRAENVRDYLIQKGIQTERIILKACGASFPLATPYINGIKSNIAERNNKRIDFLLTPITSDIEILVEDYGVSEPFRDEKFTEFRQSEDTLVFRLLLARTQQMYRHEVLNLFDPVYIEKIGSQELNAYLLGHFSMYADAWETQQSLRSDQGITSTIIPYYKGKPLAKELITYLSRELPELKIYLENEK